MKYALTLIILALPSISSAQDTLGLVDKLAQLQKFNATVDTRLTNVETKTDAIDAKVDKVGNKVDALAAMVSAALNPQPKTTVVIQRPAAATAAWGASTTIQAGGNIMMQGRPGLFGRRMSSCANGSCR